jgi:hypothetical protein
MAKDCRTNNLKTSYTSPDVIHLQMNDVRAFSFISRIDNTDNL